MYIRTCGKVQYVENDNFNANKKARKELKGIRLETHKRRNHAIA